MYISNVIYKKYPKFLKYLFYMLSTYEQIQKFSLFDDILIRGFIYLIKLNLEYNTNLRLIFTRIINVQEISHHHK